MPEPTPPFGEALVEAVKRITDQLLLFVLAGAIIVVGAAVAGPPGSRALVLPVLLLLVLGMVLWTGLQVRRVRRGEQVVLQGVRFRRSAVVEGDIEHGRVIARGAPAGQRLRVEQDAHFGRRAHFRGTIKHGDVVLGGRGDRELSAHEPPPDDGSGAGEAARR
jgi:hypothetical protein